MLKLTIFISIIIHCLISSSLVFCDDDDTSHSESDEIEHLKDDKNSDSTNYDNTDKNINDLMQMEDFIDPNSLYYDRLNKKIINDKEIFLRKHSKEYQVETKNNREELLKESNEDCETVKVYYKRLIKMLLLYANLKTYDDTIEGQLFIRGTTTQIETLRKIETENYSIKEIDIILGKILSEPSFSSRVSNMFDSNWDIQSALKFINQNALVIIIVCSLLGMMILLRKMPYFSPFLGITLMILIISFYMTWLELITEAEIKLAAIQTKYPEMPAHCQPYKMSILERLASTVLSDDKDCLKYYEAMMSNPLYQVTPVKVITHMITTVITYPIPLIGSSIFEFTVNVTGHLPFFLRYLVQIVLIIVLPIYLLLVIFTCRGGSIRFGIPFHNFSLSSSQQTSVPLDHTQKRQTIELIREIFAEVPPNVLLKNTESAKAVLPSDTFENQENNSSKNNAVKECYKLIYIKSDKELDHASGDSDKNNLFSKETREEIGECVERLKIDTEKYIGGGDA